MPSRHKDRLTATDASFLHQEHGASHMHVGAIFVFEAPMPSYEEFLETIASRLHMVPRYRQKLAFPGFQAGRPFWVDDPNFHPTYHLRHTALPSPGSDFELRKLAGRIFSQRLDRTKPLWEMWLVEGLSDNRFALITKTHHSLVDGISGVDLMTVLFDLSPVPPSNEDHTDAWTAKPPPSQLNLIGEGVKDLAGVPFGLARRMLGVARRPRETLSTVLDACEGLAEVAWAELNPAPKTILNQPIGPHRRLAWVHANLEDFKAIKRALGGTVNDVVLAVVTRALRQWLRERQVQTQGLELRALVPVSIRSKTEKHELGNRLALVRAPLPLYCEDPAETLQTVRESMGDLKRSKQALGAEVITGLSHFAPPTMLAQASRLNFSTRLFNLLVTNVPGPQLPLYVLGRELEQLIPVPFLADDHVLAIASISYNGKIDFGLLGDYDLLADLDQVGARLHEALDELLAAAHAHPDKPPQTGRRGKNTSRAQT
jgi:diacylglycerol O-acyltransferase / wax synthase